MLADHGRIRGMKFNRFVWDLYKESPRGQAAIAGYSSPSSSLIDDGLREIEYPVNDSDETSAGCIPVDIAEVLRIFAAAKKVRSQEEANRFIAKTIERGEFPFNFEHDGVTDKFIFGDDDGDWYDYVAGVSLGLHMAHSTFFLPYFFRRKFNHLEEIHAEFGIPLPPVPGKLDKDGRSVYYAAINQVWQEFRIAQQSLSC